MYRSDAWSSQARSSWIAHRRCQSMSWVPGSHIASAIRSTANIDDQVLGQSDHREHDRSLPLPRRRPKPPEPRPRPGRLRRQGAQSARPDTTWRAPQASGRTIREARRHVWGASGDGHDPRGETPRTGVSGDRHALGGVVSDVGQRYGCGRIGDPFGRDVLGEVAGDVVVAADVAEGGVVGLADLGLVELFV